MLRSIREIESLTGRLEANRILRQAVEECGAVEKVTDSKLMNICDVLTNNRIFHVEWRLRRMLARVVGDIIGKISEKKKWRIIGKFCESRLDSAEGLQLLAEAASENSNSAIAIGEKILQHIITSTQPQAQWQLLRRWPIISNSLSSGIDYEYIMELSNKSIKRMFIIANIIEYRKQTKKLKQLLINVIKDLKHNSIDKKDNSFQKALIAWMDKHPSISISPLKLKTNQNIDTFKDILILMQKDNIFIKSSISERLALSLEIETIEKDLINATGQYISHRSKFSEGRYGITKNQVYQTLSITPDDYAYSMILNLLNCIDDGIRWGVAATLPTWWVKLWNRNDALNIIERLINDEHPWVVREALQQISKDQFLCQAIASDHVISIADNNIMRFKNEGWAIGELIVSRRKIKSTSLFV